MTMTVRTYRFAVVGLIYRVWSNDGDARPNVFRMRRHDHTGRQARENDRREDDLQSSFHGKSRNNMIRTLSNAASGPRADVDFVRVCKRRHGRGHWRRHADLPIRQLLVAGHSRRKKAGVPRPVRLRAFKFFCIAPCQDATRGLAAVPIWLFCRPHDPRCNAIDGLLLHSDKAMVMHRFAGIPGSPRAAAYQDGFFDRCVL